MWLSRVAESSNIIGGGVLYSSYTQNIRGMTVNEKKAF